MRDGAEVDLRPLAVEACRVYLSEYPDEQARYGPAGAAWCLHDKLHLLSWAFEAANGYLDMSTEVGWLVDVLKARDFPLDRLARALDIAAAVVQGEIESALGRKVARALSRSADDVRACLR